VKWCWADSRGQRPWVAIGGRCAISVPAGLSPVERHSATGPVSSEPRSAKLLLASLMCMGTRVPLLATALEQVSKDPDMKALLDRDIDRSTNIAASWYEAVFAVLSARQRTLVPRFV
jgi:hypothetical protein